MEKLLMPLADSKKMPLSVYIFMLGGIAFFTYDINISADMVKYMNYALNIFSRKGYTEIDGTLVLFRGPLFPIMISWCYWLLGVSPWSAFWVVRIFCVLNPVVVYFLAKRLFGKRVGFTAALLLLTSYSINFWSYRHIDAVWTFFILISILFLLRGIELDKNVYIVLSAFLCAISFLVKETTLLILPFPILLIVIIREFRIKRNIFGMFIWFGTVFITICPWLIYIYYNKKMGLNSADILAGSINFQTNLTQLIRYYLTGLIEYFLGDTQSLSTNFTITPLFIIAWLFALLKAFKKSRGCQLCCSLFILLSPYIAFVGKNNMRVGQLILFLLLTYIVLAYFLNSIAELASASLSKILQKENKIYVNFISVIVVSIIIGVQLFAHSKRDLGGLSFFNKSFFVNYFQNRNERKVKGVINESLYITANWIENNIPQNTVIIGGSWAYNRALHFLTRGKYDIRYFPLIKLEYLSTAILKRSITWRGNKYSVKGFGLLPSNDLIFFSTHGRNDNPRWAKAWLFYESHLLAELKKENIKYVIIGPVLNFLTAYFERSNSFLKIASFNNGSNQVFKVKAKISPMDHNIFITRRTISCLNTLKKKDSKTFKFITKFLNERVGFEDVQINSILSDQLTMPFEKVRFIKQ